MNGLVITCEDCGEHITLDAKERVYMQDILKESGWINENGYWYCPHCTNCGEEN